MHNLLNARMISTFSLNKKYKINFILNRDDIIYDVFKDGKKVEAVATNVYELEEGVYNYLAKCDGFSDKNITFIVDTNKDIEITFSTRGWRMHAF